MREEKNLTEQFFKINMVMMRMMHQHRHGRRGFGDPRRGQGRVLTLLLMKPEITQKELGYLLDMRNQSLGELLSKLENNGYIVRTPSEKDKRTMNIKLTAAGKKAAEEIDESKEQTDKIFDCLNEEEKESLGMILDKVSDHIKEYVKDMESERGRGLEDFYGGRRDGREGHHHHHEMPPFGGHHERF